MAAYAPIECSDYDILEIACMDRYEIEVALESGTVLGIADGLNVRSGEEYLRLQSRDGTATEIRLDRIHRLSVCTRPARFAEHEFAAAVTDQSSTCSR